MTGEDPEPSRPLSETYLQPYAAVIPGELTADLTVPTITDDQAEPAEQIQLRLYSSVAEESDRLGDRDGDRTNLTLDQVEAAGSRGVESDMRGIGEMARASGLSVSALRFYDGAGVLVPAEVDPDTGYRRYADDQLRAARLVASLRRVGMPIARDHGRGQQPGKPFGGTGAPGGTPATSGGRPGRRPPGALPRPHPADGPGEPDDPYHPARRRARRDHRSRALRRRRRPQPADAQRHPVRDVREHPHAGGDRPVPAGGRLGPGRGGRPAGPGGGAGRAGRSGRAGPARSRSARTTSASATSRASRWTSTSRTTGGWSANRTGRGSRSMSPTCARRSRPSPNSGASTRASRTRSRSWGSIRRARCAWPRSPSGPPTRTRTSRSTASSCSKLWTPAAPASCSSTSTDRSSPWRYGCPAPTGSRC